MSSWTTLRGLVEWQTRYAQIGITDCPPPEVRRLALEATTIFSSPVTRAWRSAQKLVDSRCILSIPEAVEPALPVPSVRSPTLPVSMVLPLIRMAWLCGWHNDVESLTGARERAVNAAAVLADASDRGPVILVGHGVQNRFIGRTLQQLGWSEQRASGSHSYWSTRTYERT